MDSPVWINCSECDFGTELLEDMVTHILETHPQYTADEAEHYAQIWQDDAYEREDLENIERAEYFRRHGVDPFKEFDDDEPGK
jgi:hypothetical protein